MNEVATIREQVSKELADPQTLKTLVSTTFKGVPENQIQQAMVEGMLRGFKFKDFLERNIYAVPYGGGYSLVTGIDHARKVGMRSGVIFKSEPKFEEQQAADGKTQLVSCSITIKRRINQDIGEFTAKVYFREYYAGNKNADGTTKKNQYGEMKPNLWDTKPRTMIAKVAEMHALRMACPEELSQAYSEEELEQETKTPAAPAKQMFTEEQIAQYQEKIGKAMSIAELEKNWAELPAELRGQFGELKNQRKGELGGPIA